MNGGRSLKWNVRRSKLRSVTLDQACGNMWSASGPFWRRQRSPRSNGCHFYNCDVCNILSIFCDVRSSSLNPLSCTAFSLTPKIAQTMMKADCMDKNWIFTKQTLNQVPFWVFCLPRTNWAIMSVRLHTARGNSCQECSTICKRRETSCRRRAASCRRSQAFEVLRNRKVSETISPIDTVLSKPHEKKFTYSRILAEGALSVLELKFTQRRKDDLEYQRNIAGIDERQFNLQFVFPCTIIDEIMFKVDEWISTISGRSWTRDDATSNNKMDEHMYHKANVKYLNHDVFLVIGLKSMLSSTT